MNFKHRKFKNARWPLDNLVIKLKKCATSLLQEIYYKAMRLSVDKCMKKIVQSRDSNR